jgi:hypothetical protein
VQCVKLISLLTENNKLKSIAKRLLPWLLLFSLSTSYADSDLDELRGYKALGNEWRVVKNDRLHKVTTYAKQEDDKKYRSFKVEAELNTSLETLAKAIFDIEGYTKWFWKVREAKILRKVSETEFIFYMVNEAPPGNPDRDVILRVEIEPYTKARGYLGWKITTLPDYLPLRPPFVRMTALDQVVKAIPLADNKVSFTNQGYINPGGVAPTWAINYIQKSAPYYVMLGLVRVLDKDEYKDSSKPVPFKIRAD